MGVVTVEFKARIVDDFTKVMQDYWSSEKDIDYSVSDKDSFNKLAKRIAGEKVTILRIKYCKGYDGDYFEKIDNNWSLPTEAFVEIK